MLGVPEVRETGYIIVSTMFGSRELRERRRDGFEGLFSFVWNRIGGGNLE